MYIQFRFICTRKFRQWIMSWMPHYEFQVLRSPIDYIFICNIFRFLSYKNTNTNSLEKLKNEYVIITLPFYPYAVRLATHTPWTMMPASGCEPEVCLVLSVYWAFCQAFPCHARPATFQTRSRWYRSLTTRINNWNIFFPDMSTRNKIVWPWPFFLSIFPDQSGADSGFSSSQSLPQYTPSSPAGPQQVRHHSVLGCPRDVIIGCQCDVAIAVTWASSLCDVNVRLPHVYVIRIC